jgi:hypothetical protein
VRVIHKVCVIDGKIRYLARYTVHVLCSMPLCLVYAQAESPSDNIIMLCICYVSDDGPESAETCRSL